MTTRSTSGGIFLCLEFGTKFQRNIPLFLEKAEFSYNTVSAGGRKTPCKNLIDFFPVVSIYHTGL